MTLEELCKKCEICQSQRNIPPAGIPHPWMYPTAPCIGVGADRAGPTRFLKIDFHQSTIGTTSGLGTDD